MTEEKFSPQESLQVIQSMIAKAKQEVQNNSFYFLLWGWLVFTAAILHFALMKYTNFKYPYLAWNIMWIGVIVSIVSGIRQEKTERVKTYIADTMSYFGISLGIIFSGLAFIFSTLELWQYSYPIYILVYAVACFFMGSIMQFTYLRWAGIACLLIVVASVYVDYQWQLLLMALAVLLAYIIPGHILHSRHKNQNH